MYAAGAPGGHIDTVTTGTVSNLEDLRHFPFEEMVKLRRHFELCGAAELDTAWYIQSVALFSEGSSGGGLFNADGDRVGITTFGDPVPGDRDDRYTIRFAVPAVHVQTLMDERPDRALLTVVKHFAETDEFERAITTIGRIGSTSERVRAWVDVAKTKLSKGRKPSAIRTLSRAEATARSIEDPDKRARRLTRVAGAFVDAGAFGHARRIAASIAVLKEQALAYRTLAMARAKQDHFANARATVRQIRDGSIRARTSDFVLERETRALMRAGNLGRAREAADGIGRTATRVSALRRIARAYGKLPDVPAARRTYAEAIRLAHQIPNLAVRVGARMEIAGSLARSGFPVDARETVDAVIGAAERIREAAARDEAYLDLVDRLWNMTGFGSTQSRVAGLISDPRVRDSATRIIAGTLAERGAVRCRAGTGKFEQRPVDPGRRSAQDRARAPRSKGVGECQGGGGWHLASAFARRSPLRHRHGARRFGGHSRVRGACRPDRGPHHAHGGVPVHHRGGPVRRQCQPTPCERAAGDHQRRGPDDRRREGTGPPGDGSRGPVRCCPLGPEGERARGSARGNPSLRAWAETPVRSVPRSRRLLRSAGADRPHASLRPGRAGVGEGALGETETTRRWTSGPGLPAVAGGVAVRRSGRSPSLFVTARRAAINDHERMAW